MSDKQLAFDAIKAMARGMPEREKKEFIQDIVTYLETGTSLEQLWLERFIFEKLNIQGKFEIIII